MSQSALYAIHSMISRLGLRNARLNEATTMRSLLQIRDRRCAPAS